MHTEEAIDNQEEAIDNQEEAIDNQEESIDNQEEINVFSKITIEELQLMSLRELQSIARNNKIKIKGTKSELFDRINLNLLK